MRFTSCLLAGAVASVAVVSNGLAAFAFVSTEPNYNVNVGQTVNVVVYFQETHSGTSTLETEDGLFGAGFKATSSLPGVANVQLASDVAINTVDFGDVAPAVEPFGNAIVNVSGAEVDVTVLAKNDPGPDGSPSILNTNRVQIATLTYTALAEGVANISLGDRDTDPGSIDTSTYSNFMTDIGGSSAFTITVMIPEPSTMMAGALVGGLFLRRRRV